MSLRSFRGMTEASVETAQESHHPEMSPARTDPAELAWHLYRHHGLDLAGIAGTDPQELWEIHRNHHGSD
jgi:hypothetical protein